jgi:hypothetical protein
MAANPNARHAAVVAELAIQTRSHTPPGMTNTPDWFRPALGIADHVVAAGEMDNGSAGNFGLVEFEAHMLH